MIRRQVVSSAISAVLGVALLPACSERDLTTVDRLATSHGCVLVKVGLGGALSPNITDVWSQEDCEDPAGATRIIRLIGTDRNARIESIDPDVVVVSIFAGANDGSKRLVVLNLGSSHGGCREIDLRDQAELYALTDRDSLGEVWYESYSSRSCANVRRLVTNWSAGMQRGRIEALFVGASDTRFNIVGDEGVMCTVGWRGNESASPLMLSPKDPDKPLMMFK